MANRLALGIGIAALLELSSCSSTEPSPNTFERTGVNGGTRLAAVFVEAAPGVEAFRGFRDRKLGVTCSFAATKDGGLRCLPSGDDARLIFQFAYGDAACTQKVAAVSSARACTTPRYAASSAACDGTGCAIVPGQPVALATVYQRAGGDCVPAAAPVGELVEFNAVPSGEFVVAVEKTRPADPHVLQVFGEAEDGARWTIGFRDATEGFDCGLQATVEGTRCFPRAIALKSERFSDDGCSIPVALGLHASPRFVIGGIADLGAPTRDSVFAIGTAADVTYENRSGACAVAPGDGVSYYGIGAPVPLSRFAAGAIEATLAANKVGVLKQTIGAVSVNSDALWLETPMSICFVGLAADGKLRCMPSAENSIEGFYADPACAVRVEYSNEPWLTFADTAQCPARIRVFEKGVRHQGPVFRMSDGVCVHAHDSPPRDSTRTPYHQFPVELPAERFVQLRQIEP